MMYKITFMRIWWCYAFMSINSIGYYQICWAQKHMQKGSNVNVRFSSTTCCSSITCVIAFRCEPAAPPIIIDWFIFIYREHAILPNTRMSHHCWFQRWKQLLTPQWTYFQLQNYVYLLESMEMRDKHGDLWQCHCVRKSKISNEFSLFA